MRAWLEAGALRAVRAAAESAYPKEACGVLLGRHAHGVLEVREAHPCPNVNADRAHDRYLIDPKAQLKVEKDGRARGLDVLGYFHSHPDHPALASETDSALSWENTLYLIQSVQHGRCAEIKAWHREAGAAHLGKAELLEG